MATSKLQGNDLRKKPKLITLEESARAALATLVRTARLINGSPDADVLFEAEHDGVRCVLTVVRLQNGHRPPTSLSPRESEIVRMVALGFPNKIIADVLEISTWTVCTHIRRIFAKLRVSTRAAMVANTPTFERRPIERRREAS